MYIPDTIKNLKDVVIPRIYLGIMSPAGCGKTTSALTFPNPIVADFDDGLTAFAGRDIPSLPFHDTEWCKELGAKDITANIDKLIIKSINRRNLFQKMLQEEFPKFAPEQTLVVDSWTALQDAFDIATLAEPAYNKQGQIDTFSFWNRKQAWSIDITEKLRGLRCNVVVTFHEFQQTDENNNPIGKMRPLMQGAFSVKIPTYFSNFFRQTCLLDKDKLGKPVLVDGRPLPKERNFLWQIRHNNIFDAKCRIPFDESVTHVPATYEAIAGVYSKTLK